MKKKLSVEIHKSGSLNDEILKMVANHNEGIVNVDLGTIRGFIYAKYAIYPTVYNDVKMTEDAGAHKLDIFENGKPTISIVEKEIPEVSNEDLELISKHHLS